MIELKEIDYPELNVDYLLKLNREMFTSPLIKIIKEDNYVGSKRS